MHYQVLVKRTFIGVIASMLLDILGFLTAVCLFISIGLLLVGLFGGLPLYLAMLSSLLFFLGASCCVLLAFIVIDLMIQRLRKREGESSPLFQPDRAFLAYGPEGYYEEKNFSDERIRSIREEALR